MAAGSAFLTQVSTYAWKCSECPLIFTVEDALAINGMLDRFIHHVKKAHQDVEPSSETGSVPRPWRPRRRAREERQS